MKCKKRSEVSYENIILELLYYYCWDAKVDERVNKRYQRLRKIANPSVWKPYGRSIADIAKKKWIKFSL